VAGSCEHGNETSVPIKEGTFLDKLSDCRLINKGLLHVEMRN
jgi:hypothetical protein